MSPAEAIKHFDGKKRLADALGVRPSSVTLYVKEGALPNERQWQLELLTNGQLKADIAPEEVSFKKTA